LIKNNNFENISLSQILAQHDVGLNPSQEAREQGARCYGFDEADQNPRQHQEKLLA
jgi:hypothetical protein